MWTYSLIARFNAHDKYSSMESWFHQIPKRMENRKYMRILQPTSSVVLIFVEDQCWAQLTNVEECWGTTKKSALLNPKFLAHTQMFRVMHPDTSSCSRHSLPSFCWPALKNTSNVSTYMASISIYQYRVICIIEGSLEVKLLTIWTDEKQRWEESERREE